MRTAGIDRSLLLPIATKPSQTESINKWAASVSDQSIMSFGTIHPDYPLWKDQIEYLLHAGIKGIKFHPEYQDFYVDDERMFPLYDALFFRGTHRFIPRGRRSRLSTALSLHPRTAEKAAGSLSSRENHRCPHGRVSILG